MNQFEFMNRANKAIAEIAFYCKLMVFSYSVKRDEIKMRFYDGVNQKSVSWTWYSLQDLESYAKTCKDLNLHSTNC